MLVYNYILEGTQAEEMSEEYGGTQTPEECAAEWFRETFEYDDFTEEDIKYKQYVCAIPEIGCEMYYNYGADYFFCVKKESLSESRQMASRIMHRVQGILESHGVRL